VTENSLNVNVRSIRSFADEALQLTNIRRHYCNNQLLDANPERCIAATPRHVLFVRPIKAEMVTGKYAAAKSREPARDDLQCMAVATVPTNNYLSRNALAFACIIPLYSETTLGTRGGLREYCMEDM
jgi:hypothetical protein